MQVVPDRMSTGGADRAAEVFELFIAWTAFQRRQVSMAEHTGFETFFLPVPRHAGKLKKGLLYLRHALNTWRVLRLRRPRVVYVQLPQLPLLWVALLYCRLAPGGQVRVVADCHNAMLRPPWSSLPFTRWSLGAANAVLVHNEEMLVVVRRLGWKDSNVRVLEDVPPLQRAACATGQARAVIPLRKPWVVFPGSFSADEPIAEVLSAARVAPEMGFILTGNPATARRNGHLVDDLPPNVVLTGYLPAEVFDDLLREADVVLGLTRFEGIQLSVCNEALGFGRALVTSNTRLLAQLFGSAAILVDTADPQSIAAGCQRAFAERSSREKASAALGQRRLSEWLAGPWARVRELLG